MDQDGLDIDTYHMQVIHPLPKHTNILACINTGWYVGSIPTQHDMATLLGHTQTVSTILPLDSYFSIHLKQWLNTCLAKLRLGMALYLLPFSQTTSVWHTTKHFHVPSHLVSDIQYVCKLLTSAAADAI